MRASHHIIIVALLVLTALISACQPAVPPTPTPTPSQLDELHTARAELLTTLNYHLTVEALTPSATPSSTPTAGPSPTPRPTPTPYPTIVRTPPAMPSVETVYGQGAVPAGALARIGIGRIAEIELSPDGSILAVGTAAGIYAFDSLTGAQLWEDATYAPVVEIEWSPDGAWIAARMRGWDNVLIWDGDTGNFVRRLESGGVVVDSMAWSPDRSRFAIGYLTAFASDQAAFRLQIWNLATWEVESNILMGTPIETLLTGDWPSRVTGLAWSTANNQIAAISGMTTIALIDPADGRIQNILSIAGLELPRIINSVSFSPDGSRLVGYYDIDKAPGAGNWLVYVWEMPRGRWRYTLEHDGNVNDVSWSLDGTRLAVGTDQGQVRIWDMATGDLAISASDDLLDLATLAWSSIGERFITSNPANGELLIWNPATGERISFGYQFGDMESFSPTAYVGREVNSYPLIWDSAVGQPRWVLRPIQRVENPVWSPDQSMLAVLPWAEDRDTTVSLWSINGQFIESYTDAQSAPEWIREGAARGELSPYVYCWMGNEENVAYGIGHGYEVEWEAIEGEVASLDPLDIRISIRDSESGAVLHEFIERDTRICEFSLSPDGSVLAISHWGEPTNIGTTFISLIDMETGEPVARFAGHTQVVEYFYWSPNGSLLATGSWDGTVLIWQIR